MNETSLTQELLLAFRTHMDRCMAQKLSARFQNAGRPDVTLTWEKSTSWWEVKFYNDKPFDSPPLQQVTCLRLAEQGICHYVIYEKRGSQKRTLIVHPSQIAEWQDAPDFCSGFNHTWVARFARTLHRKSYTVGTHEDHR